MLGILTIGKELTEMTPVVDKVTGRRAAILAQVDQGEYHVFSKYAYLAWTSGFEERLENTRFNVSGEQERC